MKIKKQLMSSNRYNIKSPYKMNPVGLTIHNTANDASARSEIAYMVRNNNQTSYHLAVDDKEAIQAIPFNRNAWHAGDGGKGAGNRRYIGLEICYSKSGGAKFDKAEENAANVAAQILKQHGWTTRQMKRHKDHSGKNCPHRTMAKGWDRFVKMVDAQMNNTSVAPKDYLQLGDRGKEVKKLQEKIAKLGGSKMAIDGIFGKETFEKVRTIQKRGNLEVDGIFGKDTIIELEKRLEAIEGKKEKDLTRVFVEGKQEGVYSVDANVIDAVKRNIDKKNIIIDKK